MTIEAIYNGKNQDWDNATTTYWFQLDGHEGDYTFEAPDDVYGISDCDGIESVIDEHGNNISALNPSLAAVIESACVVTEAMRNE